MWEEKIQNWREGKWPLTKQNLSAKNIIVKFLCSLDKIHYLVVLKKGKKGERPEVLLVHEFEKPKTKAEYKKVKLSDVFIIPK